MTSRDEAMCAAADIYRLSVGSPFLTATAGADAERKRIVEWLRADSPGCSYVAEYELIDAIERGDHWKDEQ